MSRARWGWLLLLGAGVGGCSGQEAPATPADARAEQGGDAEDAAFLSAYQAGFASVTGGQRQDAPAAAQARRDAGNDAVDRDFITGYAQLTSLPARDVAAFVESGEADKLLDARYRILELPQEELLSANVMLFIAAWEAFSGERASAAQAQGLRDQMQAQWTQQQAASAAPDAARRKRLFELLAALLVRENTVARQSGDPARIEALQAGVREDFIRQTNNDLAKYRLTDHGFIEQ